MRGLENKVALITGVSSGIGAACALRLAQEGVLIAGFDVAAPNPARWQAVEAAGKRAAFWAGDVRDEATVANVVEQTVEKLGRLDIVVNAAGVGSGGLVEDLDVAEWERVLDINLKGTFLVCKYALRKMVALGAGNIVNLASIEGLEGFEMSAAYSSSKGGVIQLTRNLAIDYGRRGIRVNCICPGLIDTPMTAILKEEALKPIRDRFFAYQMIEKAGTPEDIAAAAAFLASDDAAFVTGSSMVVDGGFTAGRRFT
jgi:meso-butanediol dehydrogenase / (S,S)-butanediol dehydrogenase / diacetyl reductase